MDTLQTLNTMLGWGTLLMQVVTVFLAVVYITKQESIERWIGRYALLVAFGASFVGAFFTLLYSEYFGIVPCGLCWFQRIFLYPQVFMFAVAWFKRDVMIVYYSATLSIAGMIVALYQHALQMGVSSPLPCPSSGEADCAKRLVFELGYITFPLMAASLFAFLIVLMLIYKRSAHASV